jgi:hypothetical protein
MMPIWNLGRSTLFQRGGVDMTLHYQIIGRS